MNAQRSKVTRVLYLVANNERPLESTKRRLARADLLLVVDGCQRLQATPNASLVSPAARRKNPQDLARLIHQRFLAEDQEQQESRGVCVILDEIPDAGVLSEALSILASLGYVARPQLQKPIIEGDEALMTIWLEHATY